MLKLEQQAWEATGDARFAAGYLMERLAQKSLSADDPLLKKALREFPEDSWILSAAIAVDPNPSQELLVQGIKAEYRHFSAGSGLLLRPSARTLRTYFSRLAVKCHQPPAKPEA